LIQGNSSLVKKGLVMLAVHAITVICVSQLPETKGAHMGRVHTGEIEDLDLTEEQDVNRDTEPVHNGDHVIT
jgi:hypothetical protein